MTTKKQVLVSAIAAIFIFSSSLTSVSQVQTGVTTTKSVLSVDHIDKMPMFPGGEQALQRYLDAILQYPADALEQQISGIVYVRFGVLVDGSIDNVEVVRSLTPSFDAEALRIMKTMPKWTPGTQNGAPISVYYTLPIMFKYPFTNNTQKTTETVETQRTVATQNTISSTPPQFPGGSQDRLNWLSKNLIFPEDAVQLGIDGRVEVGFFVDEDGSLTDIKVVESSNSIFNDAAILTVKRMPKWIPGTQNGEVRKIYFTLPITFLIEQYRRQY